MNRPNLIARIRHAIRYIRTGEPPNGTDRFRLGLEQGARNERTAILAAGLTVLPRSGGPL
jgi:hypothetical protein